MEEFIEELLAESHRIRSICVLSLLVDMVDSPMDGIILLDLEAVLYLA